MDTTPQQDIPPERAYLWLAAIVVVAAALRLFRLGVDPLWHDEVFELLQVEDFWGTLLTGANVSSHPPLYIVMMKAAELLGLHATEWGVRILAALIGIATIPAAYLVVSRLFTRRLALVTAAIVAVSAFHIVHSQDAKNYILLPLTGTLLVYACLRAWETGGRWWPVYTLAAALAFYSQAFAVPLLVMLNGWYLVMIVREKRPFVPWFVANVAAFLLVLPWILIMLRKAGDIMIAAEDWWVPRPGVMDLVFAFKTMVFGYSDQKPAFYIVVLAGVALAGWGAYTHYQRQPRQTLFVALWFAFPILAVFAISQITNSIFLFRALLPFAIPLYALIAAGLLAIPQLRFRLGAAILLFAATLPSLSDHYFQEYGPHEFPHRPGIHLPIDYAAAAEFILEGWEEGDRILLSSGVPMLGLYHYGIRDEAMHMRSISTSPGHIDYLLRSNPPLMLTNPRFQDYYPVLAPGAVEGSTRIWFVFSDWEQEHLRFAAIDTWRWMDARYTEIAHRAWRGIEVFLYDAIGAHVATTRDYDDGVQAVELLSSTRGEIIEREKILPDAGIVREPLHARRGALTLSWDGMDAFVITNETGGEVLVDVHIVHSYGLTPIAAWLEDELAEGWAVSAWYNPDPPPNQYELPTATRAFAPGDTATISGKFSGALQQELPALLCWMGPNEDLNTRRARMGVTVGGTQVDIGWDAQSPGWHWSPLRLQEADGAMGPVAFTFEASHAEFDSYANLAWVAWSNPESEARARVLTGEIIEPHEERFFELEGDALRTDVWVLEHGENSKAYRIFRIEP